MNAKFIDHKRTTDGRLRKISEISEKEIAASFRRAAQSPVRRELRRCR